MMTPFDNAANDAFAFGVAEGKLETVGRPTMTDSKVTEENGASSELQH